MAESVQTPVTLEVFFSVEHLSKIGLANVQDGRLF